MQKSDSQSLFVIRRAELDDALALQQLYRQLQPNDPILDEAEFSRHLQQIIGRDGLEIFVLESAGHIASTCYLNIIPNLTRSAKPYAVIENVVTDEAARGRGFGKRVIRYAIEQAWAAGCYKVMLMTGSKEASTHSFYQACGFSGDEKHAYILRGPQDFAN